MLIANARETERGIRPRILINGQAAAYSSFRRIREVMTEHKPRRTRNLTKETATEGLTSCTFVPFVVISLASQTAYFAASCAHFASVLRNAYAPAGGSISPVSDAFGVTMCP